MSTPEEDEIDRLESQLQAAQARIGRLQKAVDIVAPFVRATVERIKHDWSPRSTNRIEAERMLAEFDAALEATDSGEDLNPTHKSSDMNPR